MSTHHQELPKQIDFRVTRRLFAKRSALVLGLGSIAASGCLDELGLAEDLPARSDFDDLYTLEVDNAIRSGLGLLLRNQNSDGSFSSNDHGRNVGVCSLIGLALLSRGVRSGIGRAGEGLQKIGQYVLAASQESGFLTVSGATSHGPMYEHGFATLFLAELHGTDPDLDVRPRLSAAVDLIVRSQNNQGGWRYDPRPTDADLSVTVCQVMALRAARNAGVGVAKETIDRAVDYIRRSQNPDGGFMYQRSGGQSRFPLTAAAVVALYNAGIYDSSEIDAAIKYLQENFAACSSLQRETFFYYAHYYSVQAFWHRGGDQWKQWYLRLRRILLQLKTDKQGWFDFHSSEYGTAMACLILNMPRTVLPIFQR
ncbi:MAG: terpene cyclase/mutase family protein [Pirellulaceae bacterium]|nr:terpene cyclase/mutase family protein [Pirellulaceae bacterium]